MSYLIIGLVALLASLLTFFSGFGLGTLLMPVFALFFPLEVAIAGTGVVHLLNNLFKITLVYRHISKRVVFTFGIPGMLGAIGGAYLLILLGKIDNIYSNMIWGFQINISPLGLVIGLLLIAFSVQELFTRPQQGMSAKWLPVGGLLSGFFGGLSGHQGALRTAFLVRLGLSKEVFIASGIAIACLIDFTRIPLYMGNLNQLNEVPIEIFATSVIAAFAGALLGKYYLKKITLEILHKIVALAIIVIALGLILGFL